LKARAVRPLGDSWLSVGKLALSHARAVALSVCGDDTSRVASKKPQERLLANLPRTIKRQERRVRKRKARPSGLHKRDAHEEVLLETNRRVLRLLKERFAKPS
jgi:hypothetical protein